MSKPAREKLPAFGKALLEARRAGRHPHFVVVVYGNDWYLKGIRARLAVKPGEALGRDWRVVSGVQVLVLDRSTAAEDGYDAEGNRELFFLLGEISRYAAWVRFETPEPLTTADPNDGPGRCDASDYAFLCRTWRASDRRFHWPAWWSDHIESAYKNNWHRWLAELEAHIAQASQ